MHDGAFLLKITEVIKSIGEESPARAKRSAEASKEGKEIESKLVR